MMKLLAIPLLLLTAAAAPAPKTPVAKSEVKENQVKKTRVTSTLDAQRLLSNKGVSLQWIDWSNRDRGSVYVARGPVWHLTAAQAEAGGPGRLWVKGEIVSIEQGSFTLRGTIRISETPDRGRSCEATRDWHFAITQNRPYYRLRDFEWCDYLTDYIDIYF